MIIKPNAVAPPDQTVLLCDLGNVVVFFDRQRSYRLMADHTPLTLDEISRRMERSDLAVQYELGHLTDAQFLSALAGVLELTEDPRLHRRMAQAWADMFWLNDAMAGSLARLKQAGVWLVVLSNTNAIHFKYIRKRFADTLRLFDQWVISYKVGAMKPAPLIFEQTLATIRKLPATTGIVNLLYVDDLSENIQAAADYGIQGHVYSDHAEFENWLQKRIDA